MGRRRRAAVAGAALVLLLSVAQLVSLVVHIASGDAAVAGGSAGVLSGLAAGALGGSAGDPYQGYGAWVDVYDYAPVMQTGGAAPAVTTDDIDDMADRGVRTLYLQAANDHARTPDPLVDEELVAALVARAHEHGIRVVAWYLPRFGDVEGDLTHLEGLADFEAEGHRFDGVAVDIEWTRSVPGHRLRSARLVELSERLHEVVDDVPLGAIVLPPVQLEEINPALWPGFPWEELAPLYDAWLPMGYWTVRQADSPHRDSYTYTEANVRRLRELVGEDAAVHPIGGIGDATTLAELDGFSQALADVDAFGGSIYDWRTLDEREHDLLTAQLAD
jgi:hypothetical protein